MRYTMKSGVLFSDHPYQKVARIKGEIIGNEKRIFRCDEQPILTTAISYIDEQKKHSGDVRDKKYIMQNCRDEIVASANPYYAPEDDPSVMGWPICRAPRVDHARIVIGDAEYLLTMHNSQNYSLRDSQSSEILRVLHRGLPGGWILEDEHGFAPEILCGLFAFCRYIEQENEFIVV